MTELVYSADITELIHGATCPPADAVDEARKCYRYVHDPMDASSFIPVGKIDPQRTTDRSQKTICSMLALSLFSSETQARKRYEAIIKDHPKAINTLGTHIAAGEIKKGDGQSTAPDKKSHFDFHPHKGIDLPSRFTVLGAL
ncbi:hypothetical protein [Stenotrophomonas maltophilia]|uniref:hypothetical protein n=1 Tax=Stenotrophomonas maltophilia TaxID=40324 RepID=UPI0039F6A543